MKKFIKVIIILLVLGIMGGAFWVIKGRYFGPEEEKKEKKIFSNSQDFLKEAEPEVRRDVREAEELWDLTVLSSDCDNECQRFEGSEKELDYCQQACGISEIYENPYESEEGEPIGCEARSGLERDYCFKDLAVYEEEFSICEKISDKGIKKACQDRITEDILEGEE